MWERGVGDGEVDLFGERLDEVEEAVEEGLAADLEGGLIGAHAGGFSAGEDECFHAW